MYGLFTRSESTVRLQSTNVAQGPLRSADWIDYIFIVTAIDRQMDVQTTAHWYTH